MDKGNSVAQRPITVMVSTPVFTPAPGTYARSQVVSITTSTAGASLRYTFDGTTPTPNSELYTGSITVASSATIKVLATKQGLSSRSGSATYVITFQEP
ncbi:MAG: chitobiase/beta-hexosaminidase C-terminal domain-containing protein [Fibrobacteres bacterium]|nr:chitobiase/beta-hexosaminidase C-terminal domain-containing protein [Fibrobacterota bacterium]